MKKLIILMYGWIKVIVLRFFEETYRIYTYLLFKILFPNTKPSFDIKSVEINTKKYPYVICKVGRKLLRVPVENEFGKNFPVYDTENVHKLFGIKEYELVVDVGGGGDH